MYFWPLVYMADPQLLTLIDVLFECRITQSWHAKLTTAANDVCADHAGQIRMLRNITLATYVFCNITDDGIVQKLFGPSHMIRQSASPIVIMTDQ